MVSFYKIWTNYNDIQLTKKTDLNNRKMKNPLPSLGILIIKAAQLGWLLKKFLSVKMYKMYAPASLFCSQLCMYFMTSKGKHDRP